MSKAAKRARTKARPPRRVRTGERWNPNHPCVSVSTHAGSPRVALVRHHAHPYREDWTEADGMAGLFAIAGRYLALVNRRLGLPRAWLEDLARAKPMDRVQLRWFHGRNDPRDSYWVRRYDGLAKRATAKAHRLLDQSAVLVAGLCYPSKGEKKDGLLRLYGGQGLRVIAQIGALKNGRAPVRITGVSSTLPPWPRGERRTPLLSLLRGLGVDALGKRIRTGMPAAFGLAQGNVVVKWGLPLPDERTRRGSPPVVFAKTAPDPKFPDQRESYALVAQVRFDARARKYALEPVHKRPLVACVHADAKVFIQDPVSKNGAGHFARLRPNRSWLALDPERVKVALGDLPAGTTAGTVQLVDPDPGGNPDFRVTNSVLVEHPLLEKDPKEVPASVDVHARSNAFAAVNAFHHTAELFARMRRYGLLPAEYFRHATRPVDVRYRAGIRPGAGDGRAVNAQVRWILRPDSSAQGTIEARFALGDFQSAIGRLPSNLPAVAERSPLGVAADPRWCWHEYCHVLIAAAIGELEFGFAHSAGDAIAAILCDPDSKLACDSAGAAANAGGWRGVTYPWVPIPRRHDRDVQLGWGWTGVMNRRERYFLVPGESEARGYWTEQILSSALFRLYRAIGGDSEQTAGVIQVPAVQARRNAADCAVYLIMRAIDLLGSGDVTPTTSAECFVEALILADTGTAGAPGPGGYVGGTVHKVVQWAFEQQGLHGVPVPNARVSGPESVAPVDLHIEDRRAITIGPYSPVDLLGKAWHAKQNVIRTLNPPAAGVPNKITVKVQNRGSQTAGNTRVDVWVARVNAGAIPPYPDAAWQHLGSDTRDVPGAAGPNPGKTQFGRFAWTPQAPHQQYAILAAASCDADRSNIDPATDLPCVTVPGPIHYLVACDNNLGLSVVTTT